MHTLKVTLTDGSEVRIHHNSDWSGDAIVVRGLPSSPTHGPSFEARLPAELLKHHASVDDDELEDAIEAWRGLTAAQRESVEN